MAKELAVVLNSGSIASAVTSAIALQKHRLIFLHVDDQPTPGKSTHFYDLQQQHFKPHRNHRVNIPFLASLENSETRSANADPRTSATGKLVELMPLVALGLRVAIHHGAKHLYCGLRIGSDSPDFPKVLEHEQIWGELVAHTCDQPDLEMHTPLLDLEPWQVLDLAFQVSAPLELTWSCENQTGEPCGQCRGCTERENAFVRSGRADPAVKDRRSVRAGSI